ncbi:MAG: potassium-transporting ATPase subunit F [Acidiferrobacteraceae bacterium]
MGDHLAKARTPMSLLLALVIAVALYLVYAIIFPERF